MKGLFKEIERSKSEYFWTVLGQGENIRGPFDDGRKL